MELEVLNHNTYQIEKHPVHFMDISEDKQFYDIVGKICANKHIDVIVR